MYHCKMTACGLLRHRGTDLATGSNRFSAYDGTFPEWDPDGLVP